jgi:uncharacterized protein YbjT (DUF2867 family)
VILVTAANGRTGRAVIDGLAGSGEKVRAFDHNPAVKQLDSEWVEGVIGDMSDAATVREVMEGVRTVVHVGPVLHPYEADIGHVVISEARRSAVEHFVYFSITHPQLVWLPNHQAKLDVERSLLRSRVPFTILQPTYYMQNVDVHEAVATGVLSQPFAVHTKVAHVDLQNVATITAQVVTRRESHLYATYQLCGGDSRSMEELARIISEESGVEVRPEPWTYIAGATSSGADSNEFDDYRADCLLRLIDHYERYGIHGSPNVLTWLLGGRPTSFPQYVRRRLAERERAGVH